MKHRQLVRKGVQLSVLTLLLAIPFLAIAKVGFVQGTLCAVGTGGVVIACPIGTAQTLAASRSFDGALVISSIAWLGLALLAGRIFCSWICPQGFASELGDKLRGFVRAHPAGPDSKRSARRKRIIVASVFGAVLVASAVAQAPVFCYVCPVGAICRSFVGYAYLGAVGTELAVVALIIVAEMIVARRGWCKYICPMGALYGACATKRSVRVVREPTKCVGCKSCEAACPMGESPMHSRISVSCTNCSVCVDDCPEQALVMSSLRVLR